jgi:hypothetical protein
LGSHIYHKHGYTAREYKEEYELPYKMPLISDTVREKKQVAFNLHRKKYLKNLAVGGKEYQFKKGQSGYRRISEYEMKKVVARIKNVNATNKAEKCPVCHMEYDKLPSHLFNKHGLLRVKDIERNGKRKDK